MPDPGLTDLLAAHLTELIADAPAPNHEEDNYDAGYVAALADLRDSAAFKLVVEQHTNGRIAELEARIAEAQSLCNSTGRYNAARQKHWNIRVFACDVLAALKGRAALEGET